MRNMQALLGIKKTTPKPSAGPMPMAGMAPPVAHKNPFIKKAAVGDTAAPEAGAGLGDTGETKMSPEKALVSHADENCGNCTNYSADSGECSEVDGTFQPDDRCWAAYSASGGDSGAGTADASAGLDDATSQDILGS